MSRRKQNIFARVEGAWHKVLKVSCSIQMGCVDIFAFSFADNVDFRMENKQNDDPITYSDTPS